MNAYCKTNTDTACLARGGGRPQVLLVGGTDPSGGAGLFADAKAVAAMGAHGCFAITALTVQDSGRVHSWSPVTPRQLHDQMLVLCDDGPLHGMKTGMLGGVEAVEVTADIYRSRISPAPLVVDPVLVSGSGDSLSRRGLSESILKLLVPGAGLLTPNLDEAEALTGKGVRNREEMETAGRLLVDRGAGAVLIKGGHLPGEPCDVLVTRDGARLFPGKRLVPGKVHGTGCTLASACAALMAGGHGVAESVDGALRYLRAAIRDGFLRNGGYLIGHLPGMGPGPKPRNTTGFYAEPRFCPACGEGLLGTAGHRNCPACGLVFYRNPLPAVMIVAGDPEGRILLVRRAFAPGRGELCLPGGFMDLGESPEECARRELMEETGLKATSMVLEGSDSDCTAYGGVALFVFRAEGLEGEPVPGDDASEVMWMPPNEAPPLAFAAHNRVLREMLNRGK